MKKPTRDLKDEHEGILLMLSIMEKVAQKLQDRQAVDPDHLQKIVEFLQNFADKCHHGKEEGILFPKLRGNQSAAATVTELLAEHQTGRDYIRGISESLPNYQPGNSHALHIAINTQGYIRLLTDHIAKENTVLFPVIDRELSAADQTAAVAEFEKLERDVIGEGKHEEYHGWLKDLSEIYLK